MPVVYVREQGSIIRKRGGRLLVEKDGTTLREIPVRQIDAIAVFGNVQVTTQAMSEALERGVPFAFYTRYGRLKGRLAPEWSKNVVLRLAQYRAAADPARRLELARPIVAAKLRNCAAVLGDYRSNYPSQELAEAEAALEEGAEAAGACTSLEELLGREGAAAASYFTAFGKLNRSALPFDGRRKRPAPDPINALLSLGYTMVMNELRGLAEGLGMEPHIGFLHAPDYGRPSLALDLLEPFRAPVVDRLTLHLVNRRVLTEADFGRRVGGGEAGSVVLTPAAFTRYLEAYEAAMLEPRKSAPAGMRAALSDEVEKLAGALRSGGEFGPFQEGG